MRHPMRCAALQTVGDGSAWRICPYGLAVAWSVAALIISLPCHAAPYEIVPGDSVFAVITHKTGMAARFAHNHFVAPKDYTAAVSVEDADPLKTSFQLSFLVKNLIPDDDALKGKWMPAVVRLGILREAQGPVSPSDQASIREHMLDAGQLDVAKFPEIKAELIRLVPKATKAGSTEFAYVADVRFTLHGKTVEREFSANMDVKDGALHVEATGRFRFTEFGITPYSAMLGAVRNEDGFDVYVNLTARPSKS